MDGRSAEVRTGFGQGKKIGWGRKAFTNYTRLPTGKGNLSTWIATIDGDSISTSCRRCKTTAGDHLVFDCTTIIRPKGVFKGEAGRRTWRTWEDIDIGNWTEVRDKGGGKEETLDHALCFFAELAV